MSTIPSTPRLTPSPAEGAANRAGDAQSPALFAPPMWRRHLLAALPIALIILTLAVLANRVSGHETVALGTIAARPYLVDGFYGPEQNPTFGPYRWSEPLAQLVLPDWGPGRVSLQVSGTGAGTAPTTITLTLGGQVIGQTQAVPGQPWTVGGTAISSSRNPTATLEGPALLIPQDPRPLARIVQQMEIRAPDAADRALLHLALLALGAGLLYLALLAWGAGWGLAVLISTTVPAVYGLLVVYRDLWLETVVWVAPGVLLGLLVADWALRRRWGWQGRGRAGGAALVGLLAALFLLVLGTQNAFDADLMYRVAAGLAELGVPTKYPGLTSWTKYGFGQPLLATPFYALGKGLLLFGGEREALTRFTVALTNLAITTLTAGLLYRAGRRWVAPGVALAVVATYLLGTPALPYARTFFSEPAGGLLLLCAWLLLVPRVGEQVPGTGRIFLAGLTLAAMLPIKPAFAIYIPVAGLLVLAMSSGVAGNTGTRVARVLRAGVLVATGPLLAVLLQLGYNYYRYALPFHSGYEREPGFSTPLLDGLYGLLLSPGKSLFLYAPVLLLMPFGLWRLAQRGGQAGRVAALLIVGWAGVGIGFNALWWAWTGNFAWGPRLLVPLLPLLCLPLCALVKSPTPVHDLLSRFTPAAWLLLAALGALGNIPGALADFQVYYGLRGLEIAGQVGEAPTLYDPAQSPLLVTLGYAWAGLTAAFTRPSLASTGLPPAWDWAVPAALTTIALIALWLAVRQGNVKRET